MPHAPFDSDQIESTGLHHAFLGHYNRSRDDQAFTFPGNPDPLALGEDGCWGVVVANIQGDGTVERERASVGDTQAHDLGIDVTGSVSQQDVRDRVHEVLEGLSGFRSSAPLSGEISAHIDSRPRDLSTIDSGLDPTIVEVGKRHISYHFESIREKQTVRGEFVQEVWEQGMPEEERQRIVVIGLRALDGRNDLGVTEGCLSSS